MCIPPFEDDPKHHFNQLQTLANENSITELSIGMSGDYKDALPFKPTYIRLGTILFGERN
jgi:Predicted enzyme with a TIM-barrel fold